MSSLKDIERRALEKAFGMESGYVLDFTDATFRDFFQSHGVEIDNKKYRVNGNSKAKRLRAFWMSEPDDLVGRVLGDLLAAAKEEADLGERELSAALYERCMGVVHRMVGKLSVEAINEQGFLEREIREVSLQDLPLGPEVIGVVQRRLDEARLTLNAGAFLSTIFLCGSLLEAILLGAAESNPEKFNRASATPLSNGKPLLFSEWKLVTLIDVAEQCNLISPDVKQFSHGMRDFRNYIHPAKELASGFTPDLHTARLCMQALLAAFADLAGHR